MHAKSSKVKRHTNKDDLTFQYGVVLGDFEGGNLRTWNSKEQEQPELDVHNKIVKLDGRLFHQVTPVTSGIRYRLYYKLFDRNIDKATEFFAPAEIVFDAAADETTAILRRDRRRI